MAITGRTAPLKMGANFMVNRDKFEPMRNNNFEVQIVGLNNLTNMDNATLGDEARLSEDITLSVASYGGPSVTISPITVSYGNSKVKFAGVPDFGETSLTINDFIGMDTEQILYAWFKLGYDTRTQKIGRQKNYKKTAYLIEYSPDGAIYRQWKLTGCWLSNFSTGDFNQEGGSVRQLSATLQYDWIEPDERSPQVSD